MLEIAVEKELSGPRGSMRLEISVEIEKGAFVAISGESGSGKTTLLRILAGLEEARGRIVVEGEPWLEEGRSLPPQKRSIGFVFQEYALFENMTVLENLLYVQRDESLARELLEMTALTELADRYPGRLSGGQKQRVALCRALMKRPRILLLDEPLSALDPAMRRQLQGEILRLHRVFGTTTLMVSHDPAEIYRLADRVLELRHGELVADGPPRRLLLRSAGSRKVSFVGELLSIEYRDLLPVAIVAIGPQLVEVVLDRAEAEELKPGERVRLSAKAFASSIEKIGFGG
ncbi:ABC transporter ATP-binding protein [Nitratifractor sp.]